MTTFHIITYNGKPATLETLEDVERTADNPAWSLNLHPQERRTFVTGKTANDCRSCYNWLFGGYTWKERPKGVECRNVQF